MPPEWFQWVHTRDHGIRFVMFCPTCKGIVFGCPDPACDGEVHHWERDGKYDSCTEDYSIPRDLVIEQDLTKEEDAEYVEWCRIMGRRFV